MMNRGFRQFVVDLQGCELMDSTFMGTLAGIALRLRELGQGGISAVHLNERNRDLLENLGLDRLIDTHGKEMPAVSPPGAAELEQTHSPLDATEKRDLVLSAHEALAEANPENAVRFKDVLEFLKQEAKEDSEEN